MESTFGAIDIAVFVVLLTCSSLIGIYFAYRDRTNSTTDNYYYGSKQVNPVAIGLSLAVTFRSSIAVIATPAEAYITGTLALWAPITDLLVIPIAMLYFMPAFHRLQLNTIYEFLELRFCKTLRRIASGMYIFGSIFYIGTIIYLPAVALNAVADLPVEITIILTGVICTIYTTLGGIKAVIWTDVLQSGVMIVGIVAIFIQGLHRIGGFDEFFNALARGDRFTALRFDYGIISRLSPLSIIIGNFLLSLDGVSFSQSIVQRYQSCKTVAQARWALFVYSLPTFIIGVLTVGNGLVMYAFYEGCDPVLSGELEKIDQGIPNMVLKLFDHIPGATGLFISAVFSACLSSVSSSLNSLSVIILEDVCVARWPRLSERMKLLIGKIAVVVMGSLQTAMAVLIFVARSNVVELLIGFLGLIYGPLAGIFVLGFFFPWATAVGSLVGIFSGYALLAFLFVGKHFFLTHPYVDNVPPVSVDSCVGNMTLTQDYATTPVLLTTPFIDGDSRSFLQDVFNINYNLSFFIGFLSALTIGLASSFAAGHTPASKSDPKFFIPLLDNELFSKSVRKFFRFGVAEIKNNPQKKKKHDRIQLHLQDLN